jgi:hypothetical protein
MNSSTAFAIWIPIALTQIILFSIYLFRSKNKEYVVEETIDIIPIYVYNNMAYWKQNGNLVRAPYRNSEVDTNMGQRVDQLNSDLLPSELMEIIEGLEKA